jgi:hypothetical protein
MNRMITTIGLAARLAIGLAMLGVVVVWSALTRAGKANAGPRMHDPGDDD